MMHVGKSFCGALLVAGASSTLLAGDFVADVTVVDGSTATVQLVVEIDTSFGVDTDDSTATKPVAGVGEITVDADVMPVTSLGIPMLQFDLGSAQFNYQFFCLPIIGCQSLNVEVSNFLIGLQKGGVAGSVDGSGIAAFPAAPFVSSFDYTVSGIADIVGSNVVPELYPFSTGVLVDGTSVLLSDLILDPIVFEIPPEDLPIGINSVQITANVNLVNVSLSGPLESTGTPCPGDFDGNGVVDGSDFGSILAAWGKCKGCPQDFDGDGMVGGADVGAFLAAWGGCP